MNSMTLTNEQALLDQVSCVRQIDPRVFELLRHEALTVPAEDTWVTEYSQFQSGGWWTLSLLNKSGDPADVKISDCDPVETTLLREMPMTRKFLTELGLRYMWARIARLGSNSFLWEHRDYDELDRSERYRLHIPLTSNSSAALVTGGAQIHLAPGRIWQLTPTHVHGACNLLGPDRYHLLLDCYADDRLTELVSGAWLNDSEVSELPRATRAELETRYDRAQALAKLGFVQSAEKYLLRLFYERAVPEGLAYDMIASLHDLLEHCDVAERWRANKEVLLGLSHRKERSA
ncbi:aspartyl/asparaginyl beta-hydroxylase domain-containing protein [Nocardia cyriacigeorgica]|uniref:aspartyl/asparaginyl beta-hydroxylase domain-containing protein n=1 Tax=Nocardia cyriacigeorgica TaxID=135487 RepID=UPI0011AFD62D|nr:aspartyl/asparaginyl beta-hydroxylase domain-containing protein [Nocardia cyriacigeorgica]